LNVKSDGEEVMPEGKSFHILAPATGKARHIFQAISWEKFTATLY